MNVCRWRHRRQNIVDTIIAPTWICDDAPFKCDGCAMESAFFSHNFIPKRCAATAAYQISLKIKFLSAYVWVDEQAKPLIHCHS